MRVTDEAEDDRDKQEAGDVDAEQELAEGEERGDSVLADSEGHGSEGADGSGLHDDGDDSIADLREGTCAVDEALLLIERGKGDAGEDGEEEDLEDLAFGEGADEGVGDDVKEEVDGTEVLALGGVLCDGFDVECGRVDVHAAAGLNDVRDDQANAESERGDDFKVEKRFDSYAAELSEVAYAGDADDDGEEDDGSDHHPDELDEAVPEWLEELCEVRPDEANDNSGDDPDENAEIKSADEVVRFAFGW